MTKSNAHELIIHAHHALSRWQRWLSWSLTLLGWLLWLSLWWPALKALSMGERSGLSAWSSLMPYAGASFWFGAMLVVWARVNYWHFSAHEQRLRTPDVSADELAADLGVPAVDLQDGRLARVLVVHHWPAGGIARIESDTGAIDAGRLALPPWLWSNA